MIDAPDDNPASSQLRTARDAKGLSMAKLGKLAGTTAQQVDRLEKGHRKLTREWAERLAPHLSVTPESLVFDTVDGSVIPVVGLISGGGSIETAWEQQTEPLYEIKIPFSAGDDVIGLEIRGESMWPKYDPGDVIVVSRHGEPIESVLGYEAAVRTRGGDRYFKRIIATPTKGRFDLESYNAPTIRNVQIEWVAGLIVRVPAVRWQRLNGKSVKQALRKVGK